MFASAHDVDHVSKGWLWSQHESSKSALLVEQNAVL